MNKFVNFVLLAVLFNMIYVQSEAKHSETAVAPKSDENGPLKEILEGS